MIKREENFLLLAADSTHLVMKVELLLKEVGLQCRVIPLPSELKASCGLSVKCEVSDFEKIKEILFNNKVEVELYKVHKIGLSKTFEKI